MSRSDKITLSIITLFFIVAAFIVNLNLRSSLSDDSYEYKDTTKLDKLKDILISSGYFENSKYKYDESTNKLTIDKKYDIYVKNGYYQMNVKDKKRETEYCNIVDAINMSLGGLKGESINTCHLTLDGYINLEGINVDFYDTYKVLTIKSEEKPTLYNESTTHNFGELISVDEINYGIKEKDYLFTLMSTKYDSSTRVYSICGNVFNKKKKSDDFTFTIYNNNKEEINSKVYRYDNKSSVYALFCVDFENETGSAKYYSIK